MTYEEFKSALEESVKKQLPENVGLSWRKMVKNNNCVFDGMVFAKEDSNVSPTIYSNRLYEQYREGESIEKITEKVMLIYECGCKNLPEDFEYLLDFEKIKDRIIFRLVNGPKNEGQLSEMPHRDYYDLSMIYVILLSADTNSDSTIRIKDEHLDLWKVTEEELYEIAMTNTPKLLPSNMMSLARLINERLFAAEKEEVPPEPIMPSEEDLAYPMFVLTNSVRLCGAGCLLYPNKLDEIEKILEGGFYILPSSVHEVLLVPERNVESAGELNRMVSEVNSTCVDEEEYLADHVYYYSEEQGFRNCA